METCQDTTAKTGGSRKKIIKSSSVAGVLICIVVSSVYFLHGRHVDYHADIKLKQPGAQHAPLVKRFPAESDNSEQAPSRPNIMPNKRNGRFPDRISDQQAVPDRRQGRFGYFNRRRPFRRPYYDYYYDYDYRAPPAYGGNRRMGNRRRPGQGQGPGQGTGLAREGQATPGPGAGIAPGPPPPRYGAGQAAMPQYYPQYDYDDTSLGERRTDNVENKLEVDNGEYVSGVNDNIENTINSNIETNVPEGSNNKAIARFDDLYRALAKAKIPSNTVNEGSFDKKINKQLPSKYFDTAEEPIVQKHVLESADKQMPMPKMPRPPTYNEKKIFNENLHPPIPEKVTNAKLRGNFNGDSNKALVKEDVQSIGGLADRNKENSLMNNKPAMNYKVINTEKDNGSSNNRFTDEGGSKIDNAFGGRHVDLVKDHYNVIPKTTGNGDVEQNKVMLDKDNHNDKSVHGNNSNQLPFALVQPYEWDTTAEKADGIKCVELRTMVSKFTICACKGDEDEDSLEILKGNIAWRSNVIQDLQLSVLQEEDIFLIDIGAGIGVDTLAVASLGHNVIAVEPCDQGIKRMQQSVNVNHVGSKIQLYKNVVLDQPMALLMSHQDGKAQFRPAPEWGKYDIKDIVTSITLNDLAQQIWVKKAVLKIDVPEMEKVLKMSNEFFEKIDVVAIVVKWNRDDRDLCKFLVTFFQQKGYRPYRRFISGAVLDTSKVLMWLDKYIIWKKTMML